MKNKEFDCVEMKWQIQQRIAEETRGMSEEDRRRYDEASIVANPVLARLWRDARRVSNSGLVPESRARMSAKVE
jgi:hypothetical protein